MRTALGLLIAIVLGVAVGRISGSLTSPKAAPPSPGLTRERAGVEVGFPRTREGAALAVGSYQQAFADKAILKPYELRRRIEAVATPRFAPVMLRVNRPGALRLWRGAFGEGVRARVPSAYLGIPVAYRLLAFTPSRAVVQTWGFTLLGNVISVEPTAYFGLSRTVLVWMDGDWKIADTRASFGPTPRLASPRPGGEGLGLVELAEDLHPYGVAP
jgi:hypothetical protein